MCIVITSYFCCEYFQQKSDRWDTDFSSISMIVTIIAIIWKPLSRDCNKEEMENVAMIIIPEVLFRILIL